MARNAFSVFSLAILGLSLSVGLSDAFAAGTAVAPPTNVCGSAAGQTSVSAPLPENLCKVGKANLFSEKGNSYWLWECEGANDGKAAAEWCYTVKAPSGNNAACGTSFFKHLNASPTTGLCAAGTATTVVSSGPAWYWNCNATNTVGGSPVSSNGKSIPQSILAKGTDASCFASKNGQVNPILTLTAKQTTIASGATTTISWSTADADTCTASGAWTGTYSATQAVAGSVVTAPATTEKTYSMTCTGFGKPITKSVTVSINPVPTASLTVSPVSIAVGGSTKLTWSSANATSCTASNGWTGAKSTSGTLSIAGLKATTTYDLTCTGAGGTSSVQSATVTVVPVPTVKISATPTSVVGNQTTVLTWSSVNATSCTASGAWTGAKAPNGTLSLDGFKTTATFALTCTGIGGTSAPQSVTITLVPAPTVSFSATPISVVSGGTTTLKWAATNATACTATNGWVGQKAVSGTVSVADLKKTSTFALTCTGPGGIVTAQPVTVTVVPAPVVSFSATPNTIVSGGNTTLSWQAANATSCVASGGWTGAKAISGTLPLTGIKATTAYTLTCTGAGGTSVPQSVTITVLPVPTVNLFPGATTIASGATSTLTWTSTGSTSCLASGGWSGTKSTAGMISTGDLKATTTYTLACSGPGGTAAQSVTIDVVPVPTVSLSANVATIVTGGTVNLTWSSTNATTCVATNGWIGAVATHGTVTTPALKATTNFTLVCNGVSGNAAQSVTVTVTPAPINGACGTANGTMFTAMPTTNLCSVGTASQVTGTGPWAWTCAGQYSGTTASCTASVETASGTFERPFSAQSPWNSRPVNPVFGTAVLPKDVYFPAISAGAYSTESFKGEATDGPMVIKSTVYNSTTKTYSCDDTVAKLYDADAEVYHKSMVINHWPSTVVPASGGDGHADIYDMTTGVIHSFWQLRNYNGEWCATEYTWTAMQGRGWGDPAHYMQGPRSAGVPTTGGILRIDEVNDGDTMYHHAIAMSLPYSGMSRNPTHIFPSTVSDSDAATTNYGPIPEGGLLMLPPSFDITKVHGTTLAQTVMLQKIARTLQVYGARVVDRNFGTPYVIYVENGAAFNLEPNGWDNNVANSLVLLQNGLRLVESTTAWLDANGNTYSNPDPASLNMLSMRNVWTASGYKGVAPTATFNTLAQAVEMDGLTGPATFYNAGYRALTDVKWGTAPTAGLRYRITPTIVEGTTMTLSIVTSGSSVLVTTGPMTKGQVFDFTWPTGGARVAMKVITQGTTPTEFATATLVNIK